MKLNKRILRRIIIEEANKIVVEKDRQLWESMRPKIRRIRKKLINRGYSPQRVDEQLLAEFNLSALSGIGSRVLGLGASEYTGGESESLFGGMGTGVQTALEQSALEMVVKKLGLDPYRSYGLVVKNSLELVIKKYSAGELTQLFSGGKGCNKMAYDISKEVLVILEESSKERVLKFALDSIGGELGADFQNSPFFKPIYQNMREKFSEAFDNLINEESLAQSLSEIICETLNMSNMVDAAEEYIGTAANTAFGEFANAVGSIGFSGNPQYI